MELYVTIVKYGDPYGTKLTEVWFDKKAAKNRCRMPLYHSGSAFDVESYKLYRVGLGSHNLLKEGNRNDRKGI